MEATKEIDKETYDKICDEVRHVLTHTKQLTNRVQRLEKLLNELATGEGADNGT